MFNFAENWKGLGDLMFRISMTLFYFLNVKGSYRFLERVEEKTESKMKGPSGGITLEYS